jgi:hypothetical protein
MSDKLTEQQLQEELLDEVGDFTRAITRKMGQGIGAVKGAGQKVKGAVKRGAQSLGQAYTQGRDSVQKKVAGKDYKAPTAQAKTPGPGILKRAAGAVQTGIGKADALAQKTLDKVDDVTGYDWRSGLPDRSQQTYTGVGGASIGSDSQSSNLTKRNQAAGISAKLQKTDAEAQRKANLQAKLGKTGTQASAQNQSQKAIQKSIARNKRKQGSISKGIGQVQRDSTGKIVSTGKGPQRDSKGNIVSRTAKDVAQQAKVTSAKIGGQKIDLNDPKMANIRRQIQKQA